MRTIPVRTGTPYQMLLGEGLLRQIGGEIRSLPDTRYESAALVADDTVYALYGEQAEASLRGAGLRVSAFVFPHGEASKSLATYGNLLAFLAESGVSRSDVIVALGGGVTGDLAGFAAATWQRGTDFVQIPTTLLAAVDSSVGGKTAVNIPQGKNLAGAFWQPRLVLCDTTTLSTLSEEQFADGTAEIIKYGCIRDSDLFALLERDSLRDHLEAVIARSVEIKSEVVSEDERDHAQRMLLNFGHTLGHAIESLSHYAWPHGHAVAVGMNLMAKACQRQGMLPSEDARRVEQILIRHGLPTTSPYSLEELCARCASDKKRTGSSLSLIALEGIGKGGIHPVPIDRLLEFLQGA